MALRNATKYSNRYEKGTLESGGYQPISVIPEWRGNFCDTKTAIPVFSTGALGGAGGTMK